MIIQSTRIWVLEHWTPAQLDLQDGKIKAVLAYGSKTPDIDYGTHRILPGFIDTHCHGAFGFDTNDAVPQGLIDWLKKAPAEGLTSICPTTITQSEAVLTQALKNVVTVSKQAPKGARIAGIHFEGPYLNVKYKGAQPEAYILNPDLNQFKRYQAAAENMIKIMTLAVENDPDLAFVRDVDAMGVRINVGHSAATYAQAFMGFANGAKGITHTYNAMSPLNHREPGLVGAALNLRPVMSELICDGIHVSWPAVKILFDAKGKDHVILVTDALCAKGLAAGHYDFGGQKIEISPNGAAYLDGSTTLAGSTLKYNHSVRNAIVYAGVDEASAINAATINPARYLGLDKRGLILAGYDADLTVLDDAYDVISTFVRGEKVYE